MEDTSLEDFLDAGDESGEEEPEPSDGDSRAGKEQSREESQPSESDSHGGDDSAVDPAEVAPAEVTALWMADGRCCTACGTEVKRLWTDGDTEVCSACKNWE